MQKPHVNAENAQRYHLADRPTNRAVHRVACTGLKIEIVLNGVVFRLNWTK